MHAKPFQVQGPLTPPALSGALAPSMHAENTRPSFPYLMQSVALMVALFGGHEEVLCDVAGLSDKLTDFLFTFKLSCLFGKFAKMSQCRGLSESRGLGAVAFF
jgi:hypothetical protein